MCDSRGFALPQEDAGEGELQGGCYHLFGQGFELELDVGLCGHGTGILLHVDAAGGQRLPPARRGLLWRDTEMRGREKNKQLNSFIHKEREKRKEDR